MDKIKMVIELSYDADFTHGDKPEDVRWFFDEILLHDKLTLHSDDIGDEIGVVKVLSFVEIIIDNKTQGIYDTSY